MTPTEQLKEEHKAIKLALEILEKICQKIEAKDEVRQSDIEAILEFIRTFADKCHHGKEEDLLFPALEETGLPREGGPTGMMLLEHDQGRNYVKSAAEAFEKIKQGDESAKEIFTKNARNYISLLREHIDKEDNILYMMADMHISEEVQKELLEKFQKVEEEKIGQGKHEEFHRLLEELKKTYLV